jgi:hypothetical protein
LSKSRVWPPNVSKQNFPYLTSAMRFSWPSLNPAAGVCSLSAGCEAPFQPACRAFWVSSDYNPVTMQNCLKVHFHAEVTSGNFCVRFWRRLNIELWKLPGISLIIEYHIELINKRKCNEWGSQEGTKKRNMVLLKHGLLN